MLIFVAFESCFVMLSSLGSRRVAEDDARGVSRGGVADCQYAVGREGEARGKRGPRVVDREGPPGRGAGRQCRLEIERDVAANLKSEGRGDCPVVDIGGSAPFTTVAARPALDPDAASNRQ